MKYRILGFLFLVLTSGLSLRLDAYFSAAKLQWLVRNKL